MTINPYTLKELRQLTRSRIITGALVAYLFISLAATYFISVAGITQHTGANIFAAINALLTLVLCFVLPFSAYRRISAERGAAKSSADLTLLTAIPPSGIIDGKLRSAFALMALFACATTPFGATAYLLHGVTFKAMGGAVLMTVCCSCVAVHASLAIASFKMSRAFRHTIFCLAFLPYCFMLSISTLGFSIMSAEIDAEDICHIIAGTATICLLLRAYSIAFLSPSVMERDASVKWTTLLAILGWGAYGAIRCFGDATALRDATYSWSLVSTFAALSIAAYALSQPVGYSRRILAARAKLSPARRVLTWPFSSGAANTFCFALVIFAIVASFMPSIKPWLDARLAENFTCSCGSCKPPELEAPYLIAALGMYIIALMLAVRALWRFISGSANVSPLLVPVIAMFALALLQSIPGLMSVNSGLDPEDYHHLPFVLAGLEDYPIEHLINSAIALGVGILINLRALAKAIRKK